MNLRFLLLVAVTLAALLGLWAVLKPQPQSQSPQFQPDSTAQERQFVLNADELALAGAKILDVQAGDLVVLKLLVSADDELHVHGYDFELELQADQPATLRFTADKTGRFELELHHSHLLLAVLQVAPR